STIFVSWKASVLRADVGTCPVIMTRGTLSRWASAMAVMVFVAPGPEVTTQTPTWPVVRAWPMAAQAAPGSVWKIHISRYSAACKASIPSIIAPPVSAITCCTPWARSKATNRSAPRSFVRGVAVSTYTLLCIMFLHLHMLRCQDALSLTTATGIDRIPPEDKGQPVLMKRGHHNGLLGK